MDICSSPLSESRTVLRVSRIWDEAEHGTLSHPFQSPGYTKPGQTNHPQPNPEKGSQAFCVLFHSARSGKGEALQLTPPGAERISDVSW